ncbi:MAG: enoyl-CoA hydratase/isomerase family protein [Betaproteobacteria bacterium]|nr:enoyl-CoA hydratase/isomerase family protein [Betaproteobacteria bacterium]
MANKPFITELFEEGVALVTLNRPELHNAFDDDLIAKLTRELKALDANPGVRVVILGANGKSFSAGADLNWMKRTAGYTREQNLKDAIALADLMRTLNDLSKPTVARVHGPAFGGGVGLIACCDIAIAARPASFALSEVRLGIIPSVISPYVVAAIGERYAHRYFLTGERFDCAEAYRIGLVHDICEAPDLDEKIGTIVSHLLACSPRALGAAKQLIARVAKSPVDDALVRDTAERIAAIRASAEGKEGLAAFLEKRAPAWIKTEKPKGKGAKARK